MSTVIVGVRWLARATTILALVSCAQAGARADPTFHWFQSGPNEITLTVEPNGYPMQGCLVTLTTGEAVLAPWLLGAIAVGPDYTINDRNNVGDSVLLALTAREPSGQPSPHTILTIQTSRPATAPGGMIYPVAVRVDFDDINIWIWPYEATMGFVPGGHLVFSTQPREAATGSPIPGPPVVELRDWTETKVPASAETHPPVPVGGVLSLIAPDCPGAQMGGRREIHLVDGADALSDLVIDTPCDGNVLRAEIGHFAPAESAPFNVITPTASRLAFTTQPGGAWALHQFQQQPVVTAHDSEGRTATSFSGDVVMGFTPYTGYPTAGLYGTTSVRAVNGVAVFTDLMIDHWARGYGLRAASGALQPADSQLFDVTRFPFDWQDVATALRWSAGLGECGFAERRAFNVESAGESVNRIDVLDALSIARKAAGLEVNP